MLLLWAAAEELGGPVKVWEICDEAPGPGRAVLRLSARGGRRLFTARPYPLSVRSLELGVARVALLKPDALVDLFQERLSALGAARPDLSADMAWILEIAQVLLGVPSRPVPLEGPWTLQRLSRGVAWASHLIDEVQLAHLEEGRRPFPFYRILNNPPEHVREGYRALRHAPLVRACWPAEQRQQPQYDEGKRRFLAHELPELPLREGLVACGPLRRGPLLTRLLHHLQADQPLDVGRWLLRAGYLGFASRGLALAEELEIRELPAEPCLFWRLVGQKLRQLALSRGPHRRPSRRWRTARPFPQCNGAGTCWSGHWPAQPGCIGRSCRWWSWRDLGGDGPSFVALATAATRRR
jgi:hypothetical protein